jgi:IS30 family transposase
MKRINLDERLIIQDLLDHGTEIKDIAKTLNRSQNTIRLEVKKAGGIRKYNAKEAQKLSEERAKEGNKDKNSPMQHLAKRISILENEVEELKKMARKK